MLCNRHNLIESFKIDNTSLSLICNSRKIKVFLVSVIMPFVIFLNADFVNFEDLFFFHRSDRWSSDGLVVLARLVSYFYFTKILRTTEGIFLLRGSDDLKK